MMAVTTSCAGPLSAATNHDLETRVAVLKQEVAATHLLHVLEKTRHKDEVLLRM